ncbi:MAG: hypothetical protein ACTII3_06250, partial [Galactobacter sp.]
MTRLARLAICPVFPVMTRIPAILSTGIVASIRAAEVVAIVAAAVIAAAILVTSTAIIAAVITTIVAFPGLGIAFVALVEIAFSIAVLVTATAVITTIVATPTGTALITTTA